jgi:uncharacterized protein YbbC (DUF1343 family)
VIQSGLQRLLDDDLALVRGARVGIIANPTAIDRDFVHLVDRLAPHVRLTALFGPEHGIRGDAQDMAPVDHGTREAAAPRDPRTGAAVYSLYGHTLASLTPTAAMLDDVDVVIFDIQDVGARYYTFVWTMVLAMRACAAAGKRFIVLDRPNPIGGALVEGGAIAPGFESFVGLVSCPNRHGLTAGEIAAWRAREERLELDLTVVEMRGWRRGMSYAETGLPWVMPSPNMPAVDTALVYPGMCLVEGSELSEARGTTRPFELAGAPWLDAERLAAQLTAMALPGVRFRPAVYTPMFQKHAGRACAGVQQHVVDAHAYRPYLSGVAFLKACRDQAPDRFAWRSKAYEFVDDIPAIDLLCGSAEVRQGIDAGASLGELASTWQAGEAEFLRTRAPLLRYAA